MVATAPGVRVERGHSAPAQLQGSCEEAVGLPDFRKGGTPLQAELMQTGGGGRRNRVGSVNGSPRWKKKSALGRGQEGPGSHPVSVLSRKGLEVVPQPWWAWRPGSTLFLLFFPNERLGFQTPRGT